MSDHMEITGGADPEVAAAIAAVVDQVMREERARDIGAPSSSSRSAWASATHLRERPAIRPTVISEDQAPGPPAAPA